MSTADAEECNSQEPRPIGNRLNQKSLSIESMGSSACDQHNEEIGGQSPLLT